MSKPREANLGLDGFPSPADLWARHRAWKGLDAEAEQIVLQDYYADGSDKAPRYYQVNAVNAAIEAIAKGRDRALLVMATGTGMPSVNPAILSILRRHPISLDLISRSHGLGSWTANSSRITAFPPTVRA